MLLYMATTSDCPLVLLLYGYNLWLLLKVGVLWLQLVATMCFVLLLYGCNCHVFHVSVIWLQLVATAMLFVTDIWL